MMKKWFFLGIQLVIFDGVSAAIAGNESLHFSREENDEFVDCIDGCLVLSRYNKGSLVIQYGINLREGSFLSVQSCDVTRGLGNLVSNASLGITGSAVANKMKLTLYGRDFILHRSEKMIVLRCEALIQGEKEIFEFDYANFLDLDSWCKQIKNPSREWYKESKKERDARREDKEKNRYPEEEYELTCTKFMKFLACLRKKTISHNYSESYMRPLTEEEADQYFRGIEIIA